jgi:hypothetical protein
MSYHTYANIPKSENNLNFKALVVPSISNEGYSVCTDSTYFMAALLKPWFGN